MVDVRFDKVLRLNELPTRMLTCATNKESTSSHSAANKRRGSSWRAPQLWHGIAQRRQGTRKHLHTCRASLTCSTAHKRCARQDRMNNPHGSADGVDSLDRSSRVHHPPYPAQSKLSRRSQATRSQDGCCAWLAVFLLLPSLPLLHPRRRLCHHQRPRLRRWQFAPALTMRLLHDGTSYPRTGSGGDGQDVGGGDGIDDSSNGQWKLRSSDERRSASARCTPLRTRTKERRDSVSPRSKWAACQLTTTLHSGP